VSRIDWEATQDTREGWDATDLIDHWRSLAYQEHEARLAVTWMFEQLLRLSTAYPKVMQEKLESEWAKRKAESP